MRNRVLAVLAAVVLIVGAVALRSVLDDDDDGTEVAGDPGTTAAPVATGEIICIEELREQCQGISGVTIEPAGDTFDRLSTADDSEPPAAWVTFAPLQGALDEARRVTGASGLFSNVEPVAQSRLVLVARTDRGEVLKTKCGDVTWKCLGDNAGADWASLGGQSIWQQPKFGHEAPDEAARGAIVFGWAAASYFGGGPVVVDDGAFGSWLSQLEQAVPPISSIGGTPLEQMVSRIGSFDVVGTTEVEAKDLIVNVGSPRTEQFTIYPSEVATARVVIATAGDPLPEELTTSLRDALTDAGWDSPDSESNGTVAGLPDGPATEALRTRIWDEVQ